MEICKACTVTIKVVPLEKPEVRQQHQLQELTKDGGLVAIIFILNLIVLVYVILQI